ncbi:GAK system CofD-like protein [Ruegeria sp. 2012CJ41-6]|uniref:GAK system CofD-like protein n=1 Tax=Ruegeria spongiae TaxID=2942209 RepID=A0ABT0Q4Z7_9RHOB|nr:GAK system CofD-like protein [Ruegeria spongiae]MCL6284941.1 GAK system CofD-like protein [Ruegeria spongiae]
MSNLLISRSADIPDPLRVARARSLPNLGPRLLFLSGGSALNDIARRLKLYSHNSMHLITPFDSGGSSQVLRQAFDMPAVGDLRSRLMALADETELGQPDIFRLFSYRFPKDADEAAQEEEFRALLSGEHHLMRAITQPMRRLILAQLRAFAEHRPHGFDLARASTGNLILAGGYLTHDRALEPVLFLMSKMVDVRGTVRAIVDDNLGLGAELQDGQIVLGQRDLTGKELAPITAPIRQLFLTRNGQRLPAASVLLPKRNRRLIERADLICYPPGSLYTSVLANLLPAGAGRAIAARNVPKIYLPSLGHDPECLGMTLPDQVAALLACLRADAGEDCPAEALLNAVICDAGAIPLEQRQAVEARFSLPCLPLALTRSEHPDRYDPDPLCETLISLI